MYWMINRQAICKTGVPAHGVHIQLQRRNPKAVVRLGQAAECRQAPPPNQAKQEGLPSGPLGKDKAFQVRAKEGSSR